MACLFVTWLKIEKGLISYKRPPSSGQYGINDKGTRAPPYRQTGRTSPSRDTDIHPGRGAPTPTDSMHSSDNPRNQMPTKPKIRATNLAGSSRPVSQTTGNN